MGDISKLFTDGKDNLDSISGEDALAHLVGDGNKYATPADLAKAMLHGQVHISKIEQENSSLRDSSNQAKGIDDILAALKGQQQQQDDGNHHHDDNHNKDGSDKVSVADQITAAFAKRDQGMVDATEDTNLQSTVDQLQKQYGDKALDVFEKVGKDLGIDLENLARKSPAAVMKLVTEARPATEANNGLPNGLQTNVTPHATGLMDKAAIDKLFKEGKIKRHEKIDMENKAFTALGADTFYGR